jgi:hypothetical protein
MIPFFSGVKHHPHYCKIQVRGWVLFIPIDKNIQFVGPVCFPLIFDRYVTYLERFYVLKKYLSDNEIDLEKGEYVCVPEKNFIEQIFCYPIDELSISMDKKELTIQTILGKVKRGSELKIINHINDTI